MNATQEILERADTVATKARYAERPIDRVHLFLIAANLYRSAGKHDAAELTMRLARIIARKGGVL